MKKLLSVGFIRDSCSPFASPILLARKANGSWKMCIDYRALNQETIKDKYIYIYLNKVRCEKRARDSVMEL